MGWQDREYAKEEGTGGSYGGYAAKRGSDYLIGGSIITTLLIANVVVFFLVQMGPLRFADQGYVVQTMHGNLPARFGWWDLVPALVLQGQVWRLFTAQYMHAGLGHLLFNMFGLYFLGNLIARQMSPWRFFWVYTACGLAGNVFYVFLAMTGAIHPYMPAVGASGCIYGLLGMVGYWFPNLTLLVFGIIPMRARTLAIVLGVIAFMSVQTRGTNYGGEAAHLAGLVFGLWWAAWGQNWWTGTRWAFAPKRQAGTQRPSPFYGQSGGSFAQKVVQREVDAAEVDRILAKVREKGIQTLTESEKQTLKIATERERQRNERYGRTDRI